MVLGEGGGGVRWDVKKPLIRWYVGGLQDHRLDCVTHMSEHGHYSPESGEETHHKGFITHGE